MERDREARAALGSPWPWIEAPAAERDLEAVARALGGDGLDAVETPEGWTVCGPWPDADLDAWSAARRNVAGVRLRSGASPFEAEARWAGLRGVEDKRAGPAVSQCAFDPSNARILPPDLADGPDAFGDLRVELAAAVRSVGAVSITDHGPDTTRVVVHRPTGRIGLQVVVPDPTDPDAVLVAVGEAAVAAGLDPTLVHDPRQGLSIVVWVPGARHRVLPPDVTFEHGSAGFTDGPGWPAELHAWVPAGREDAVLACAESGAWAGGVARWPVVQGRRRRVWCWTVASSDAADAVRALAAVGVQARALPGIPPDLGGATEEGPRHGSAPWIDPSWLQIGDRVLVRLRDAAVDREVLPTTTPRPETAGDRALHGMVPGLRVVPVVWGHTPAAQVHAPWARFEALTHILRPLLVPGSVVALRRGGPILLIPLS